MNRQDYARTAGHPPAGVPLRAGYNPNATPTPNVPGFGGDVRVAVKAVQVGSTMLDQEEAHRLRRVGSKRG